MNEQAAHRMNLLAPDHLATCPRCNDLSPGKWCLTCGLWLLDRCPLADELHSHAMLYGQAFTARGRNRPGDAPPRREDTQTRKGKGS